LVRLSERVPRRVGLAVLACVITLWACSTPSITNPYEGGPITLTLDVAEVRLFEGEGRQLELTVQRGGSVVDPVSQGLTAVWSSGDPSIATVDNGGLLEAVGAGLVRVAVRVLDQEASVQVTVDPGAESIEVLNTKLEGVAGELVEGDVRLRVRDTQGGFREGITLEVQVLTGDGSVDPATVVTDAQGRADVQWTLGPVAGDQQLEVVARFGSAPSTAPPVGHTSLGATSTAAKGGKVVTAKA
jgi:hypothetical protein